MHKPHSLEAHAPETATHYRIAWAEAKSQGVTVMYVAWFRFTDGKLETFHTDSDNEYPCWRPVDTRNYRRPEVIADQLTPIKIWRISCSISPARNT